MKRPPAQKNTERRRPGRRRILLIVTVMLLSLLAVTAFVLLRGSTEARAAEYTRRARECYAAADYETALLYLRRAAELGEKEELLMLMADCYEAMENYPRALETLRRLNTSDPAIASRIQAIERKRSQLSGSDKVTVAGMEFDRNAKTASLDDRGLTDAQVAEVTELYALDTVSLRNNRISDIRPLAALGGLDELDLSGNQISDVAALAGIRGLRILNLSGNPLRDCRCLAGLANLSRLDLTDTGLGEEDVTALAEALPRCAILVTVDDPETAVIVFYSGLRIRADVTQLELRGLDLRELSALEAFTELRSLDLSENEIGDLRPLMHLSRLEVLNLSRNEVADLRPLIGLPKLVSLNVSGNQITDTAAVGAIESLKELDLSGNPLADFSGLGKLRGLKTLNLSETGVKDATLAELSGLTGLQQLNLQGNSGLSDRAVSTLKTAISGCSVLTSDLVYEVDFAGHTVRSDEKTLAFPSSGIWDLSGLSQLTRLEELNLRNNEISSLYPFEICGCRETLKTLDLSGNRITDVTSLNALTVLEDLDLSDNMIEVTVGLERMETLKRLNLSGNPVLEVQLASLREALPQCEIILDD